MPETDETNTEAIAAWRNRVGTLRKRGRVSGAALAVVPAGEIDARAGRPPPPEPLTEDEKALWEMLTHSRRPGWFLGSEALLESYVSAIMQVRKFEACLRKAKMDARYQRLAAQHRAAVSAAGTLASRLRLTPSARIDHRLPHDGDMPVA